MTISMLDHRPSRQVRSRETARLLAEAQDASSDEERKDLLDQVIVLNLGVAEAIARRYKGRHIPLEDLEQVAFTALTRAAHHFDAAQDRDFLTYAVPTMSGEIKRHFRDHGWTIRPPRRIQEIQSRVIHAYRAGQESGAPPSAARLAEQLELPESDVAEALAVDGCFTPNSLDRTIHEDSEERPLIDTLTAEDEPERRALEARLLLGPSLEKLKPRERRILYLRFVEERTQKEIGHELGVTQMQTSRLLKGILEKLREDLSGDVAIA